MKYFIHLEPPRPSVWMQIPPARIAGTFRFMGHNWVIHNRSARRYQNLKEIVWCNWAWTVSHVRKGVGACEHENYDSPEEAMTMACINLCAAGKKRVNMLLRKFRDHS